MFILVTSRQTKMWIALFCGIVGAWTVACFLTLYRMCCAGLDDWCYFAPGVAATRVFGIRAPLLGHFLGADHTWGIHWPGAPLLYSCLFALVPWSPLARVILFMVMDVGVAVMTFFLLRRYLGEPLVAASGAVVILCDRDLSDLLTIARPEVLSALVLTTLVFLLSEQVWNSRQRARLAGASGCFFLLPLLHPVLLLLGGLLSVYACWRFWRAKQTSRGVILLASYAAGLAVFAGWFYLQPDALHQFEVHSKANSAPFRWGGTFIAYLEDYAPLYTGGWLYALAFAGCAVFLSRWKALAGPEVSASSDVPSAGPETVMDWRFPVLTLLGGTAAAQLFHNQFYQLIFLPEAVLLALAMMQWLVRRCFLREATTWIVPGLLLFAALHGAFWVSRTWKFFRAGEPNLRAEIHDIVLSLPDARMVLVPDTLWEECIGQQGRYYFYTPPFACALDIRKKYETDIFQKTAPGDLLLIKGHGLVTLTSPLLPDQWEMLHHYEHVLPSSVFWGYELTLYRRR